MVFIFSDSFEIVPVEINQKNMSPVMQVDRNVGIESWCVKYIYKYAYSKLMKIYRLKSKRKRITQGNYKSINSFITGALLFNPDIITFWNSRREMVEKDFLRYDDEFQFTRVVLSHKPKCNEAFSYRRWLIKRISPGIFFLLMSIPYVNLL